MSEKVVQRVWEKAKVGGSTLVVLLLLANLADDHGYVEIGYRLNAIAKQAHMDVKTLKETLAKLERVGEIREVTTGVYQILTGRTIGTLRQLD